VISTGLSTGSAKGHRLQASGFSQKESEKRPATSLIWALALAEACGLKPVAFLAKITLLI